MATYGELAIIARPHLVAIIGLFLQRNAEKISKSSMGASVGNDTRLIPSILNGQREPRREMVEKIVEFIEKTSPGFVALFLAGLQKPGTEKANAKRKVGAK